MTPEKLLVECDDGIRLSLQGSIKPIERTDEIAKAGLCAGLQATRSNLESRQLDDPKAAERVIKALDQRRKYESRLDGSPSYPQVVHNDNL